jgi:hypothetical protein
MNSATNKDETVNKMVTAYRNGASFVDNAQHDAANTKSNLIQIPSITLPKGGGALKGIDEKFNVNSANGTAAFSVPLPLSPGRSGLTPALSLNYNSGNGNSPFGLGWGVEAASIQQKTDKKIPSTGC